MTTSENCLTTERRKRSKKKLRFLFVKNRAFWNLEEEKETDYGKDNTKKKKNIFT